ncbi:MAG TPA: YbjN domain-containing protein [Parvularculaceae bacterium]|nr:YbjN domain-containing protein [Parvularculaceae bacterium]
MRNVILAAGVGALAIGLAGGAVAQTSNSLATMPGLRSTLPGFDLASLAAIAQELGFQAETISNDDGSADLKITTPNGPIFAHPTVCDGSTCVGLELYAFFGSASNVSLDQLNEFNKRLFAKALTAGGSVILNRYEIADFGIPKGNVAANLTNFKAIANDFYDFLSGAGSASAKIETPPAGAEKKPAIETAYSEEAANFEKHVRSIIAAGKAENFGK